MKYFWKIKIRASFERVCRTNTYGTRRNIDGRVIYLRRVVPVTFTIIFKKRVHVVRVLFHDYTTSAAGSSVLNTAVPRCWWIIVVKTIINTRTRPCACTLIQISCGRALFTCDIFPSDSSASPRCHQLVAFGCISREHESLESCARAFWLNLTDARRARLGAGRHVTRIF